MLLHSRGRMTDGYGYGGYATAVKGSASFGVNESGVTADADAYDAGPAPGKDQQKKEEKRQKCSCICSAEINCFKLRRLCNQLVNAVSNLFDLIDYDYNDFNQFIFIYQLLLINFIHELSLYILQI